MVIVCACKPMINLIERILETNYKILINNAINKERKYNPKSHKVEMHNGLMMYITFSRPFLCTVLCIKHRTHDGITIWLYCVLLCCICMMKFGGCVWKVYPYSSVLLHWHRCNNCPSLKKSCGIWVKSISTEANMIQWNLSITTT